MRVIEQPDRGLWNEVAENCPYATIFHTPYWSDLMANTFSHVDMTKGFLFDDGTQAIFPFMRSKAKISSGFFYDFISGPPYTYGGPISDRRISQDKYDEMVEYVRSHFKQQYRLLIRGNPYHPPFRPNQLDTVEDLSHVFDLRRCENEEDIYQKYSKRYRSYVRKAGSFGKLTVSSADSIGHFEKLHALYQASKRYWETDLTHYPLKLFQELYRMQNGHIKLWTVNYEGDMIGGDINLYWKDKCFMWLSYHDRRHSKIHSRRYMLHNVLLDCKKRGIDYYDFLQSAGIEGQQQFKASMGGAEYPHTAFIKENVLLKFAKGVKRIFKA